MQTIRLALVGLGNVGRHFAELLRDREGLLRARHGLELRMVGASDRGGSAVDPDGLDLAALVEAKRAGQSVATLGRPGMEAAEMLEQAPADILLEASPSSYTDGQPGLGLARLALERGRHVVLASKGPLVLAWNELARLSDWTDPDRPLLRFGGTTCGALPTLAMGRRDLAAARILRMEGVLNLSTQIILGLMGEGLSYPAALAETQRRGLAEADPALDVEGWDAAAKLVIVANAVLGVPARMEDVAIRGITGLDPAEVRSARQHGGRYVLLARAERIEGTYRLKVGPARLAPDHPFAHLLLDEGAVLYETDIYGRMLASLAHQGPLGTAAAVLRDVIEIAAEVRRRG